MNRRMIARTVGLLMWSFALLFANAANAAEKPNILFIFADDWGWGDLSCHGHPYVTSEYGYDEYGAFNCVGEQMPVHEDARNAVAFIEKSHQEKRPFFEDESDNRSGMMTR